MDRPVSGPVTTEFGAVDLLTYTDGFHTGIDLAGEVGTPIIQPVDGEVVVVQHVGGRGLTVSVQSGGVIRRYAHLSGDHLHASARVALSAGDVAGYVGMTGFTTGPHLHYEAFIDPLALEEALGHLDVLWGTAVLASNLGHFALAATISARIIAIKGLLGL